MKTTTIVNRLRFCSVLCVPLLVCSCGTDAVKNHMVFSPTGIKFFGYSLGDDFEKVTAQLEKQYKNEKGPIFGGYHGKAYYALYDNGGAYRSANDLRLGCVNIYANEENGVIETVTFPTYSLPGYSRSTLAKEMQDENDRRPETRGTSIAVADVVARYLNKKCGWTFTNNLFVGDTLTVAIASDNLEISASLRVAAIPSVKYDIENNEDYLKKRLVSLARYEQERGSEQIVAKLKSDIDSYRKQIDLLKKDLRELEALDKADKYRDVTPRPRAYAYTPERIRHHHGQPAR